MSDREEWPPLPQRLGPDIPVRPGQVELALAEVLRRRRRKAAIATAAMLGVVAGGAALAAVPGTGGGDHGGKLATTASPTTRAVAGWSHTPAPSPSRSRARAPRRVPHASGSSRARHHHRSGSKGIPQAGGSTGSPPAAASWVTAVVRDPAGNPLTGIAGYAASASTASGPLAVSDSDGVLQVSCAALGGQPLLVVDTASGTWAWQLVGGGTSLAAAAPPACGSAPVVVLQPASVVSGHYDADGVPGAGSVVSVSCSDAPVLPLSATADDSGAYSLPGLAAGSCVLHHSTGAAPCATVDEPSVVLGPGDAQVVDIHDTGCATPTPTDTPSTSSSPPPDSGEPSAAPSP